MFRHFKKIPYQLLYPSLLALLIFLAVSYNTKNGYYSYLSSLFADESGYYVYLPAWFIYGFHKDAYPENIDQRLGNGFHFDSSGKLINKYNSGIAILIVPFFLVAHLFAGIQGLADGFGPIYQYMLNFCGPFYTVAGLWLLTLFLANYTRKITAILIPLLILGGTNLYYYTVIDPFMTHSYSFFLFTLFLFSLKKWIDSGYKKLYFLLLAVSLTFITLIRPTNILLVIMIPLLDYSSFENTWNRIRQFFTFKNVLILISSFFVIWGPQMVYWKFAFGSWISYTYTGESFIFLTSPKIILNLFSPNNGLLIYNPFYGILLIFLVASTIASPRRFLGPAVLMPIMMYITSSWYAWNYGCSFGLRPMVEYTAVLSFPFAIGFEKLWRRRWYFGVGILMISLVFINYSICMVSVYARCFSSDPWNWVEYRSTADQAGIWPIKRTTIHWNQDFEKAGKDDYGILLHNRMRYSGAHSGSYISFANKLHPMSDGFRSKISAFTKINLSHVDISCYVNSNTLPTDSKMVCDIALQNHVFQHVELPILPNNSMEWQLYQNSFLIDGSNLWDSLSIYVLHKGGNPILIDDLDIGFHLK